MGRFYGTKIKNEEINSSTGKPWTINDVPKLWRKSTEKWLKENS